MQATAARRVAVAGMFYPGDAQALRREVDACLGAGPVGKGAESRSGADPSAKPKLLVVPHAGYVYSGAVAGQAYARLRPYAGRIRRVVVLGPSHRVALRGLALPAHDVFETPLGRVAVDPAARAALAGLPQVSTSAAAHADEHSIEVQLPFLQHLLGAGFTIVPLVVGQAGADEVAQVLERLWGGDETLVVVSSDLSHYLPYGEAQAKDARTARRIAAGATDLQPDEACGARALNGALLALRRHALALRRIDLCNSGDTAGDRRRVVGYAAFVAADAVGDTARADGGDEASTGSEGLGGALLARARNAIAVRLGLGSVDEPPHPALAAPGATFVTLKDVRSGLRGCIGRLEPDAPLEVDVRRNAQAAAFADPRFAPLAAREWPGLALSVSLLGPHEPLPHQPDARRAARALRPSVDGVVLAWRGRRATFLPQVWAQLPDADDFVAALLHKAGLGEGFWAEDLTLARYEVRCFDGVVGRGAMA